MTEKNDHEGVLTVYNTKNDPIGFIPKNVVLKKDGYTLHAGNIEFYLPNITIKDHDSEIGKIVALWATDAKFESESADEFEKRYDSKFETVFEWLKQHHSINISDIIQIQHRVLNYKPNKIWQKYLNEGYLKIQSDEQFWENRITITKKWYKFTQNGLLFQRRRLNKISINDAFEILTDITTTIKVLEKGNEY